MSDNTASDVEALSNTTEDPTREESADGQSSGTAGNSQNNAVNQARISRVPASDDIPDDLEDRPLLSAKKQGSHTFAIERGNDLDKLESVRWTATAGRETASILGGAYLPEEKRRRCRGIVLCAVLVMVPLLLTALAVGLVFFEGWETRIFSGSSDSSRQAIAPEDNATKQSTQNATQSAAALSPVTAPAQPSSVASPPLTGNIKGGLDRSSWPRRSWIYQMPLTWTQRDYYQTKLSTDLAYCHMVMLTQLPNGSLASLMQASTVPGEGNAEQALYWQVSNDLGSTWSKPHTVLPPYISPRGMQLPYWSPVLHTQGGVVYMFFSVSVDDCIFLAPTNYNTTRWSPGGDVMMTQSADNGITWSVPKLVYGFLEEGSISKVIANTLYVDPGGAWLLPYWRENAPTQTDIGCNLQPRLTGVPGVLISTDLGKTWRVSEIITHDGSLHWNWMIESAIVPTVKEDGTASLLQLFRTPQGVSAFASRSTDGGMSWSVAHPTDIQNPDSKLHMVVLSNGDLLLAMDDSMHSRTPLVLAISRDGGIAWEKVADIETDPCGQFSYPTIQYLPADGSIFVAYTNLFSPSAMSPECRAKYSSQPTGMTVVFPPSGIRVYATTEALLRA